MTATCTHPIEAGSTNIGLCHSEIQFRNRSIAAYRRCEYAERFLPTFAVAFWLGLFFALQTFCSLLLSTPISIIGGVIAYYGFVWMDSHWHAGRQHPAGMRGYRRLRRCERILRKACEHARKNLNYGNHLFIDERIRVHISEAGTTLAFMPTKCWPNGLTLFYGCKRLSSDFSSMRASTLAHFDDSALLALRQVTALLFRSERPAPPPPAIV